VQREEKDSCSSEGARDIWNVGKEGECSSTRSEGGISVASSFSVREIERISKWVTKKNREERRKNIIIKGIRIPKEVENDRRKKAEWVENLIKEKLCVDTNVIGCRESGAVLVVRLESEEEKREIMRNKFRLKGEKMI